MPTRATMVTRIAAMFPANSLANPTNANLYAILTDMLDYSTEPGQRAVTATADGLTTGLLLATDEYVIVTSANADHIVTLPAIATVSPGKVIKLEAGATAFEVRTPASSGTLINNVDGDGTQEAVVAATGLATFTAVSAAETGSVAGWLMTYLTELGAPTTIVPD